MPGTSDGARPGALGLLSRRQFAGLLAPWALGMGEGGPLKELDAGDGNRDCTPQAEGQVARALDRCQAVPHPFS